MKLSVRYAYDCSPEAYWAMYWDDAFDKALQADSTVDREVLEHTDDKGVITRRLRFTPEAELPGPVAKMIGSKKLVYDQLNVLDTGAGIMTWQVLPTFISADKFSASGEFRIEPTATGCEMIVDGDIDVKIRFIGGQIEKQIVSQIEAAYKRMHDASEDWIEDHGLAS